jgi:hypothetical protein
MKIAKLSALAVAAILAITLTTISTAGCSGSGSMANPVAVQASTGPYSTASLTGAYAINLITAAPNYGSTQSTLQGTISFDGSGNVQAGSTAISENFAGGATTCTATPSGSYSITGTGSGTASITLTPSGVVPCQQPMKIGLSVQVAQSGVVALLQESDNQGFAIGSAAKL